MKELPANRRFFMHPAHGAVGVSSPEAWQACRELPAASDSRPPRRICLVSATTLGHHDPLAATLAGALRRHLTLQGPAPWIHWSRLAPVIVGHCDCLVLLQAVAGDDGQLECLRRYCLGGGAVVALGVAGQAGAGWSDFVREVLGGACHSLSGDTSLVVRPVDAAKQHPILSGVGMFPARGGTGRGVELAADAVVLLNGTHRGLTAPLAWTRSRAGGRSFATTLGQPADFGRPDFLRLVANAVAWACAQDDRP